MQYRRDVRAAEGPHVIRAEREHVREHLAMVADYDDDPTTHADSVIVEIVPHVDGDPEMYSIIGTLDAEPDAPYLRVGFDPAADTEFVFVRYAEGGQE